MGTFTKWVRSKQLRKFAHTYDSLCTIQSFAENRAFSKPETCDKSDDAVDDEIKNVAQTRVKGKLLSDHFDTFWIIAVMLEAPGFECRSPPKKLFSGSKYDHWSVLI